MNKNRQPTPTSAPLTSAFVRAGIDHPVTLSPRLVRRYQLSDQELSPARLELAWVVRSVLTGCLPSRTVSTPKGLARIAEYTCVDQPDRIRELAVVTTTDTQTITVVLPEELAPTTRRPLILIAEDNPDVAALSELVLAAAGFDTAVAATGDVAWSWLTHRLPDAVLTDVDMPGLTGLELCRRIRATPDFGAIPVLVWSGNCDHREAAMTAGAVAFLAKPLAFQELIAHLRQALGL